MESCAFSICIAISLLLGSKLEVASSFDYKLPQKCIEEELAKTMKPCVTMWKSYCGCKHCSPTCSNDEWPPPELVDGKYESADPGWKDLESAWDWSRQCAYTSTILWRTWCRKSDFLNATTGKKETYKYWFLVNLDETAEATTIEHLCHKTECPGRLTDVSATTEGPKRTSHEDMVAERIPLTTPSSYNVSESQEAWQDIIDAVGPNYQYPHLCSSEALSKLLERCIVIWQNYCQCAECDTSCSKDDWPPVETDGWDTGDRVVGWEKLKDAWKWAGKCAHNATEAIWRPSCHITHDLGEDTDAEHDYLFLTELRNYFPPKVIESLCRVSECDKFKALEKTTRQFDPTGEMIETTSATAKMPTIFAESTARRISSTPGNSTSVPKWAYIIIAVLGAAVILMCATAITCICHRKQSKRARRQRDGIGPAVPTSTAADKWKPPSSFTFFGERPIVMAGEDIYHTITDESLPELPASPKFPMATFHPQVDNQAYEQDVGSVPNMLYHDTTPRFSNISSTQFNIPKTTDAPSDQNHAYEYTGPDLLPLTPLAPPFPQPYFVTTGEYDTLGTTGQGSDEEEDDKRESRANYDHIQLMDRG